MNTLIFSFFLTLFLCLGGSSALAVTNNQHLQDKYSFDASSRNFTVRLQIPGLQDADVNDAELSVSQFSPSDDLANPVIPEMKVNDSNLTNAATQKIKIKAKSWIPVDISLNLGKPQTYKGQLALYVPKKDNNPGRQETAEITITRKLAELPLNATVSTSADDYFPLLGNEGTVRQILTNTGGDVKLAPPTLTQLTRSKPDGTSTAVDFGQYKAMIEPQNMEIKDLIELPASVIKTVKLILPDLPAGQYAGQVTLSAKDFLPKTLDFKLNVRASKWLVFLLVSIGFIASFGLRWVRQDIKPRLEAAKAVLQTRDELINCVRAEFGVLSESEGEVVQKLLSRLDTLRKKLENASQTSAEPELGQRQAQNALAMLWLAKTRELAPIKPKTLPKFTELTDKLSEIKDFLLDPQPSVSDTVESLTKKYGDEARTLHLALMQSLKNGLTDEINELRTKSVELGCKQISSLLDLAESAKDDGRYVEARKYLNLALRDFIGWQFEQLQKALAPEKPRWFDPTRWADITQKLNRLLREKDSLDLTELKQNFETLSQGYYQAIKDSILAAIKDKPGSEDLAKEITENPLETAKDKQDLLAAIKKAEQLLTEQAANAKAFDGVANPEANSAPGVGKEGLQDSSIAVLSGLPQTVVDAIGGPVEIPKLVFNFSNSRELQKASFCLSFLTFLATLTAAVLVAIFLFWANNPVWGTTQDYLTALGFGFLFDSAGGQAALDLAKKTQAK